ncbi:hypothetical protein QTP88_016862 [Uroleucon formosanum]
MAKRNYNKRIKYARRLKELKEKLKPYRNSQTVNLLRLITGSSRVCLNKYWESLESVLTGHYGQYVVQKRIQSVVNLILENGEYSKSKASHSNSRVHNMVSERFIHFHIDSRASILDNVRLDNRDSRASMFDNSRYSEIDSISNVLGNVRSISTYYHYKLIKHPKMGDPNTKTTSLKERLISSSKFSSNKQNVTISNTESSVVIADNVTNDSKPSFAEFYKNVNTPTSKDLEIAAAEGVWAYHTVQENHSFRSNDCASKLIQSCFDSKFRCARTKTETIIKNVFAPKAISDLKKHLTTATWVSISTDASNHGSQKVFPILVRYFLQYEGVQVKILEFKELFGENSDIIVFYVADVLREHNILSKIVAFCGDNTNCNFGGSEKKGKITCLQN